jgi:hypothetical protein
MGADSSTKTLVPVSRAVRAAVMAALPPPITITSYMGKRGVSEGMVIVRNFFSKDAILF